MLSRLVIAFAGGMLFEDIGDLMHYSLTLSEVPYEKVNALPHARNLHIFFFAGYNDSAAAAAAAAASLQSCPILCDPIDGSPPGSPVPGILQARALEWVYNDSTMDHVSLFSLAAKNLRYQCIAELWKHCKPS